MAGSTSGFGGLSSGGSAFGSGFAAVSKPGGGMSTFATPGVVGITGLSGKPAKPFGSKEADEDGDDEDGESEADSEEGETKDKEKEKEGRVKSPGAEEKADRRFYEQSGSCCFPQSLVLWY